MKIKCKCKSKNYNNKCSNNYCKSCCYIKNTYINCEIHSKQIICNCGNNDDLNKCKNNCCKQCCLKVKKYCSLHKRLDECICGKTFSPTCVNYLCKTCCDGVNCTTHGYKLKLCKCGRNDFNIDCINKLCTQCCNNNICTVHYINCKCNNKVKINTQCTTKSCSPKCCTNPYCERHFEIDDITNEDINEYKTILNSPKINIPTEIIHIIIDEYFDNRVKCIICNKKHNISDYSGELTKCDKCNNWICYEYYVCMMHTSTKYDSYRWCINCYTIMCNNGEFRTKKYGEVYSDDEIEI